MVDSERYEGDEDPDVTDVDVRHLEDPESLDSDVEIDEVNVRNDEDDGLLRTVVAEDLVSHSRAFEVALPGSGTPGNDLVTGTDLLGTNDDPDTDRYHNPEEYPRYAGEREDYDEWSKSDIFAAPMSSSGPGDSDVKGHLHGRVVRVDESSKALSDDATLLLAGESGTATVALPSGLDRPEDLYSDEEIVVTHVESRGEDDARAARWHPTPETDVVAIRRDKAPAGYHLNRRSQLVNAEDWYIDYEKDYDARARVVDAILDEMWIETPRGDEDMMLYIDAPESDLHGVWTPHGEIILKELLQKHLPARVRTDREKNKVVNSVRDSTRVPEDEWDKGAPEDPDLQWTVGVENGVIDLRTGEIKDHGPEWKLRQKLPVEYRPDKYDGLGEELDWFLTETMKEDADRESWLYSVGHGLCRCYPDEALWVTIGPGENGKTRLLEVLDSLFGSAISDFSMSILTGDSDFGGGPLKGAHMTVDDDATDVKMHETSLLKKHSGGRGGQINQKNIQMDGDAYKNYATFYIQTNNPPVFSDKTHGMERRVFPIIMPYQFSDDPTDDKKTAVPKEEIRDRIRADEEVEALLVEAVKYAGKLYETGKVKDGRSEDERWDIYESYSDNILRFWSECMTSENGVRVSRNAVYETYVQWCDVRGVDPRSAGGKNGFWPLSDQCHAVSYNREDVWLDGSRAVEHVKFGTEAMEYAPEWVTAKWEADVDANEDTLANRLDRVTALADLDAGYCTTKGTVIARGYINAENEAGVRVTLEDDTTAIDATSWRDHFDGVMPGDTVRVTRAVLSSDNRGVPQLQMAGPTNVEVTEASPLSDDSGSEDGSDDDGKALDDDVIDPDDDEVMTPKKIIDEIDDGDGADVESVKQEMCKHGWERTNASRELGRLVKQGEVVEPTDDTVRTV